MKLRAFTAAVLVLSAMSTAHAGGSDVVPGCRISVYQSPAGLDSVREPLADQAPNASKVVERVDLSTKGDFAGFDTDFVAVATASLEVKADGLHEFRLTSDDGSVLFIDNHPVVNHDGRHAATSRTGSVTLKQGRVSLKVLMFEGEGEQVLRVEMKAPGAKEFKVLDGSVLSTIGIAPATATGEKRFAPPAGAKPSVLVFSKTAGFRHDSIPNGIAMVQELGAINGFSVTATEDSALFTDASLDVYACVVFLSTTGDILNDEQQGAFERYMAKGRGFVGIHSASDTEYDWPYYAELVGAYFKSHPAIQDAEINVVEPRHVTTQHLPSIWRRKDEWYCFREAPRPAVNRVLMLNEASYTGGTMKGDHPVAWWQEYGGGRAFYTALGHTKESFTEPEFVEHVRRAIIWAGKIPTVGE